MLIHSCYTISEARENQGIQKLTRESQGKSKVVIKKIQGRSVENIFIFSWVKIYFSQEIKMTDNKVEYIN